MFGEAQDKKIAVFSGQQAAAQLTGKKEPSRRVLIIEDCRDGSPATGQIGNYLGDLPRSVALTSDGGQSWSHEYDYQGFIDHQEADGTKATAEFPLWEGGPKPGNKFAMVRRNPCIQLADGSVIWGDQCWWKVAADDDDLSEQQESLEQHKALLATILEEIAKAEAELTQADLEADDEE